MLLFSPNHAHNLFALLPASGMAMFQQFWYWYPYVHMVSLSFVSTAVIGLNHEMKVSALCALLSLTH